MQPPPIPVTIVGAGLSGAECALRLAAFKIPVRLFEQKPAHRSPAHTLDGFAELVCSNSLKSTHPHKAHGMLKTELTLLKSPLLEIAFRCAVPGGGALAVDRQQFSEAVTAAIENNPNITVVHKEATEIPPDGIRVMATGPLTGPNLSEAITTAIGNNALYFYDATSPIVSGDSLDFSALFFGNRYHEEETDYLNIPLTQTDYDQFVAALLSAEKHEARDFENLNLFSGCQPIEDIAATGHDSLRFGPLRPTGFKKIPSLSTPPHAVIQMRRERAGNELWNFVGCQTRLKHGEQERIFRMLPGLKTAAFVRLGNVHRNTFINSPRNLDRTLCLKTDPNLYFIGTLTGAEGYTEAIATGLAAAIFIAQRFFSKVPQPFPEQTCLGALIHYLVASDPETFQPMNFNRGLFPASNLKRPPAQAARARQAIEDYVSQNLSEILATEDVGTE